MYATAEEMLLEEFFGSATHTEAYRFYRTYWGLEDDDAGETFLGWVESLMFRNEYQRWMLRLADDGIV